MSDTRQKKGRSFRLATPLRLVTRTQACSPTLSASPYARQRQLGRPLTSQLPSVHAGFFSSRPLACYTDLAASASSCTAPSVARESSAAGLAQSLDLQPDRESGLLKRAECWRRPCPRGLGLGQGLLTRDPARPVLVLRTLSTESLSLQH